MSENEIEFNITKNEYDIINADFQFKKRVVTNKFGFMVYLKTKLDINEIPNKMKKIFEKILPENYEENGNSHERAYVFPTDDKIVARYKSI